MENLRDALIFNSILEKRLGSSAAASNSGVDLYGVVIVAMILIIFYKVVMQDSFPYANMGKHSKKEAYPQYFAPRPVSYPNAYASPYPSTGKNEYFKGLTYLESYY